MRPSCEAGLSGNGATSSAGPQNLISAAQPGTEKAIAEPSRVEEVKKANATGPKNGEGAAKSQKPKASLPKWGLSKAAGEGKPPGVSEQAKPEKKAEKATKKSSAAKVVPEAPKVGG